MYRIWHPAQCKCNADLTVADAVMVHFSCAGQVIDHKSRVRDTGLLCDVDRLVEFGYHAGTSCSGCGDEIPEIDEPELQPFHKCPHCGFDGLVRGDMQEAFDNGGTFVTQRMTCNRCCRWFLLTFRPALCIQTEKNGAQSVARPLFLVDTIEQVRSDLSRLLRNTACDSQQHRAVTPDWIESTQELLEYAVKHLRGEYNPWNH
jgi:hypothetical protein